jgi:hypothetical protein
VYLHAAVLACILVANGISSANGCLLLVKHCLYDSDSLLQVWPVEFDSGVGTMVRSDTDIVVDGD